MTQIVKKGASTPILMKEEHMSGTDITCRTLRWLEQIEVAIAHQRANMIELGLTDDQIEKALQPAHCFREQLKEEITEDLKARITPENRPDPDDVDFGPPVGREKL